MIWSPLGLSGWWSSGGPCWSEGVVGRAAPSVGCGLVSVESDVFQCPGEDGDCVFKQVDMVVETVDIQGGVVGQVDVGP